MDQINNPQSATVPPTKLTTLLSILIILVSLNLIATIVFGLAPSLFARKMNQLVSNPSIESFQDLAEGFHVWPLERQIQTATIILRVEYEKSGNRNKAIIREIFKQVPGTKFYYNIGDEFTELSMIQGKGMDLDEGQIAFFVGSPAEMRYSSSYSNNRLPGQGDITLEEFRLLCKK